MSCNRVGLGGSELLCALDRVAMVIEGETNPWVCVGLTFSGPTLLCLAIVSFFGGHNSGTASMATAVSVGAATAGIRGDLGLCSCATSVITLIIVAAAKSESWNTYMINDHTPTYLPEVTNSILAICHVVTGLPTCSLIHILYASS